ncbi:MAG: GTPase Era, partial [Pseudomonadota bacterium]
MLIEHQHPDNKSIKVAVLGAPNVGKSTLINYLLGMDLTVVTDKPQTTRNHFHCVCTVDHTEIILVDTPGLHHSNQEINKRMNEEARQGTEEGDLILLVIDARAEVLKQILQFKTNIRRELGRVWILFNKIDLIPNAQQLPWGEIIEEAKKIIPTLESDHYFLISSKTGENIHQLTGAICDIAPACPHRYPDGSVSNRSQRFFVTEY